MSLSLSLLVDVIMCLCLSNMLADVIMCLRLSLCCIRLSLCLSLASGFVLLQPMGIGDHLRDCLPLPPVNPLSLALSAERSNRDRKRQAKRAAAASLSRQALCPGLSFHYVEDAYY